MANKIDEPKVQAPTQKTKSVRNRSGQKIELVYDGRVVVFLPGVPKNVPVDMEIPNGIGLYVR